MLAPVPALERTHGWLFHRCSSFLEAIVALSFRLTRYSIARAVDQPQASVYNNTSSPIVYPIVVLTPITE